MVSDRCVVMMSIYRLKAGLTITQKEGIEGAWSAVGSDLYPKRVKGDGETDYFLRYFTTASVLERTWSFS